MQFHASIDNYKSLCKCNHVTDMRYIVMSDKKTELEKRNVTRLSNMQAKLITRTCLRAALIQLLDSREMEDITVSELTRKAGVSRTAFYSNYQTVNDILSDIIDEKLNKINNSVWEAINNKEDMFPPIIQEIKENQDLYSLVMKSNIEKTAFFQLRDYLKKAYPSIDRRSYFLMNASIGAIRNIVIEWIINGCEESVEFISSICNTSTREMRESILKNI